MTDAAAINILSLSAGAQEQLLRQYFSSDGTVRACCCLESTRSFCGFGTAEVLFPPSQPEVTYLEKPDSQISVFFMITAELNSLFSAAVTENKAGSLV